jgi:mannosyl-3-phosphoglycerate phosphatase
MSKTALLVFTDLDGTLLDHDSYSWAPALPAMARLRANGVPVILASSKTAAEIAPLRAEMRLAACPAIVENGAGVLMPHAVPEETGDQYQALRQALTDLPDDLRRLFQGFGDMTAEEIATLTGLGPDQAQLAKARGFSEPGLFSGDRVQLNAFVAALQGAGINARRGGRFLALSFGGTKAARMSEITAAYGAAKTLALGDAPNDVEMLQAADHGIIIANPAGSGLPMLAGERTGQIERSALPGPNGWNEMVLKFLQDRPGLMRADHGKADAPSQNEPPQDPAPNPTSE